MGVPISGGQAGAAGGVVGGVLCMVLQQRSNDAGKNRGMRVFVLVFLG